jgi:hypothetical protein
VQPHPEDKKRMRNRWWRITHLYRIKTKEAGESTRLILNPVQAVLPKYLDVWRYHLVLKARQQGISTFFLLWHLDATLFTPNCNTVILADSRENLGKLFQIIKYAYESCPSTIQLADGTIWHKPVAKYDTRNELYFEGINSTIYVALKIRSTTVHRLHVSEWAFIKNAQKVLTATFAAVPKTGIITGETTANGMGGSFYEEWQNENSRFIKHFFGYQDHPDYCDPVEDEEAFRATLGEDEKKLLNIKNMKLGNLAWRRRHLSIAANRKEFPQEFPATAEEAFMTSGRSPFNRDKINEWIIKDPILSKMEKRLLYWIMPQKGKRYLLVCDTASGRGIENLDPEDAKEGGTDYDVIQIWDCETWQMCAMFRGKWPYSKLHEIVIELGREYNDAYVVIEATDHGLTVLNNLTDHSDYPKAMIHTTQVLDDKSKKMTTKWGFYTNSKTRPLVLDKLEEAIEDESIHCYSQKVQSECLRFIVDDKGDMHAMDGYHDDTVMAAAIGLYCIPQALKAGRMTATKAELGLRGM